MEATGELKRAASAPREVGEKGSTRHVCLWQGKLADTDKDDGSTLFRIFSNVKKVS